MFRSALRSAALAASCTILATVALAQPAPPPPPPPEVVPPAISGEEELQPQVTITERQGEKVEEARVNGRLIWVRVTPRYGRPYYLIPDQGAHTFIRRDSNDTGLKVPLWVLFSF